MRPESPSQKQEGRVHVRGGQQVSCQDVGCKQEGGEEPTIVGWLEHHKAGDNLNWERVDHPYAQADALIKKSDYDRLREQLDAAVRGRDRNHERWQKALERVTEWAMACEEERRRALAAESELEAVRKRTIERCLKAVADEEELTGSMPSPLWDSIKGSRHAATEAIRAVVRATKAGIAERIRSLPLTGSGEK